MNGDLEKELHNIMHGVEDFDPRLAEEETFKQVPGGTTVGNHGEETGHDAVLEQAHEHGFQFKVKDSMGQRFDRWLRRPEHLEDKAK